jgi:HK97 family phage major capsid protein
MNPRFSRTATVERAEQPADDEIRLAISSETPYERWWGVEILGHKDGEVDLARLADGRHPLLLNHDLRQQIGVISAVEVGKDKVLRGTARFSKNAGPQEVLQDVRDGIRTLVSVGYMIEEVVELGQNEKGEEVEQRRLSWDQFKAEIRAACPDVGIADDDFFRAQAPEGFVRKKGEEPPVYRVTRWQPFEASLVAVPADVSVGVGRSAEGSAPAGQVQQQAQATPATPVFIQSVPRKEKSMEQKDPAQIERERTAAILDAAAKHAKYVSQKDADNAIRNGHSVEQFKDLVWSKIETKHTDTSEAQLGMSRKEAQRYSFGNLIRGLTIGSTKEIGLELEMSAAMAKMLGKDPEGVYVPYDIFRRDFNVGTAAEAGNLVATDLRTDLYVDALRAAMVMPNLGVRILTGLTGNIDIPRKVTPGALAGVTEIGSASETQPATGKLTLSPKRVSAYVEPSKQAIIQSAIPLEAMLRDDLVMGAAVQIENYAIQGSSAANGTGLIYRTGLGTVSEAANGTALLWDHLVDMETAAADANAEPDRLSGYLINTALRGKAKKTLKGTNLGFIWENGATPLNGYRTAITNNVPRNLTKGTATTVASAALFGSDWSTVVLGFFGGVDVVVDPYTLAATGQVRITLNQYWDYTARQPAAIVRRNDLLTT